VSEQRVTNKSSAGRSGWSGPYSHIELRDGQRQPWAADAKSRLPGGVARIVIRWRAPGFAHPRKRSFAPAERQSAIDLAQNIRAAQLINARADADAMPDLNAAQRNLGGPSDGRDGTSVDLTLITSASASRTKALGHTVAEARQILQEEFRPGWEENRNLGWWVNQFDTLEGCFLYAEDHPAVAEYGVAVGSSKHLTLLTIEDFAEALRIRRHTNLRAVHNNAAKKAAYEAKLARYEQSQKRSGGGRRMTKPEEPSYAVEYDPGIVLIEAGTEKHFRMVQSFMFDRAYDRGWFGAGRANTWRLFNERSSGGRRAAKKSPFRTPQKVSPLERLFPPGGFFADLGDQLTRHGKQLSDGRHLGERYRYLPLIAWQAAMRPEENRNLHIQYLDLGTPATAHLVADRDWHLKGKSPEYVRSIPLAELSVHLINQHMASGFATSDGYLWASPEGHRLDVSNFTEDYLRPALACTLELWPEYIDMSADTMKLFRKAGESSLIAYRLDASVAASWAGHDEATQIAHYRGMLAVTVNQPGAAHRWTGIDDYVHAALRDTPPCGDGQLASWLRSYLQIDSL
jgi:hypothetical protein